MANQLLDKSIDELLDEADAKLKEAGIDPNGHPVDDEEGSDGGLAPDKDDEAGDDAGDDSGDDAAGDDAGNGDDENAGGDGGASATDEEGKKITFDSAKELQDFVSEQMKTLKDTSTTQEEKKEAADKLESIKLYDDDNFKPQNWNVAFRDILRAIRPVLKDLDKDETQAVQEKLNNLNKEFDAAYDEIAKVAKLPARTTAEGKEVDRQITTVGAVYGVTDYKKAYQIWSKLPKGTELELPNGRKAKVGGLDYKPAAPAKKPNPSKEVARLQSPGKGGDSNKPKKLDYKSIHDQSMDQLLEDDL